MSDSQTAYVFAVFFKELAKRPDEENRRIAKKLYKQTKEFDFNDHDLDCYKELKKLGVKPDWPEE